MSSFSTIYIWVLKDSIKQDHFAFALHVVFRIRDFYKIDDTVVTLINYIAVNRIVDLDKNKLVKYSIAEEINDDAMQAVYCLPMELFDV